MRSFGKELLNDPDVAAEYEALEPEFDIIRSLMEARISQNMTQKELSERTGITQADISRIENGTEIKSFYVKEACKRTGM